MGRTLKRAALVLVVCASLSSCGTLLAWLSEPAEPRPPIVYTPAPTEDNPNPEPIVFDGKLPVEGGTVQVQTDNGLVSIPVPPQPDPKTKGDQVANDLGSIIALVTGVPALGLLAAKGAQAGIAAATRRREQPQVVHIDPEA